ncbi:MAG: tRNA 2-thiouridine(34) synthase MnmA [Nanoarchaeota archaeon]|nr:tRNA 2-thiouridine(34) synthase MnmA [Nanoarchaeota archaeon]
MKQKQETILLGLSGGVDSTVAALLLKKQGYKVIGAFMKNFSETKDKITGQCNWVNDKKDAQKIAAILKIPFITLNFEKEYKKYVIDPMFKAYARSLTPNPDSLCNKIIKFPFLWTEAKKLGASYIATGHYAKIKKTKSSFSLLKAKDKTKDQSYFLYELTQKDLAHTLFPIGNYTKKEIRKIAYKNNFPNYNKPGTKGICFIGKVNMKAFLKQKIKQKKGKILNPEGKLLGYHNGTMFYTIGERIGPRLGFDIDKEFRNKTGKKWYIINKKIKSNILIAAPKNHPEAFRKKFIMRKINFINDRPKFPLTKIKVRIRHLGELIPVSIEYNNKKYNCTLKKSIEGIAEGQSAVIYKGEQVLGGGEIRFG